MGIVDVGRRLTAVAACFLVVAVFSACSVDASAGGDAVKKADVEKQVVDQVAAQVGAKPKSVSCPGNLKAKVGTTMRCTLIASDDAKYGLTVKVTSIKDNTVNFDIKVDDEPESGGTPTVKKADVEKKVADLLAAQVGERPASVTCPSDLVGKVGTTMRCSLTAAGGQKYGLTLTVNSVAGATVNFGIKVDSSPTP